LYYIKIGSNDKRVKYELPTDSEGGAYDDEWVPAGYTPEGILVGSEKADYYDGVENSMEMFLFHFRNPNCKIEELQIIKKVIK
jgi:hypothetical protein